ncbi:MAG: type II secretion system F family protein [Candidatus Altiarchaeia archaeon]|jgi:flagellar protein FlaJ
MDLYASLSRFMPRKARKDFHQLITYSSITVNPDQLIGFIILTGIAFSLWISQLLGTNIGLLPYPVWVLIVFIAIEAVFYLWILFSVDSKAKFAESVLPDALQLMSSNIRAGLTTDRALILAARPEFGPLADEIRRVGRETMTGSSLGSALLKINQRIKSENLSKTIDLIVSSLKSGGKLADLLDQTSGDLRDQQIVQKEISASVLLYVIFIFIAIGLGAPLLFAMSGFLVQILGTMGSKISTGMGSDATFGGGKAPMSITSIQIDSTFLTQYTVLSLLFSSVFGSLIIGLILKGNAREGFKYAPFLVALSLGLYFLGTFIMTSMFGQMIRM